MISTDPILQRPSASCKWDEFLDVYSLYLVTGVSLILEEARFKAYELRCLDPQLLTPF
ncbi:MAG: hypothetical protein KTQ49_06865 [Candidatus Omnitrophica bacterium]|nr:hypothetical protein [Candidatus Omnitrophota bacterium]